MARHEDIKQPLKKNNTLLYLIITIQIVGFALLYFKR